MKIDTTKCTSCGLCKKVCPRNAINKDFTQIERWCFNCGHCMSVCPASAISHNNIYPEKLSQQSITDTQFNTLVQSKRSMRFFTNQNLDETTVKKLANIVPLCPTGTNSQSVSLTAVVSPQKRQVLREQVLNTFKRRIDTALSPLLRPALSIFAAKSLKKAQNVQKWLNRYYINSEDILTFNAPCILLFHTAPKATTPADDAVIAATSVSYYAETLGLKSCFIGFIVEGIKKDPSIKKLLQIPADHSVHSALVTGYGDVKYQNTVIRPDSRVSIV